MAKEIDGYTLEEALKYVDDKIKDETDPKKLEDYDKWKDGLRICYERNY